MSSHRSLSDHCFLLSCIALGSLLLVFTQPPFGQDPGYHDFADQRAFLGIPNFFDVISSLSFVIVGVAGLRICLHKRLPGLRAAWLTFYAGVTLVGPGSAFYHSMPGNASLVIDRLPMACAFMGLMTALMSEYVEVRIGKVLLLLALAFGLFSVLYWHWFDDLRFYVWVQFFPLVVLPIVLLLFHRRYTEQGFLVFALTCYILAKMVENYDRDIFKLTHHLVSGHTLKHLLAASACLILLLMLKHRTN